ncbi:hypothetical protein PIB30_059988, partial [Stylosanthes scabra]|nr:hypothetical protein [Stylosanthes scabra]
MAVNESLAGSNEEIDRVSTIKATKLGWNLVVGVVRLYELPNQWISKDATSVEMVLQDQNEGECWILGNIVSVESGVHDWCYLACNNCPKKVIEVKNGYKCKKCLRILADPPVRYKLNIIVADGTGCLNLIVWSQEGKLILGKSANEVRALQGTNQTLSNPVSTVVSAEIDSDLNVAAIVSLSK